MSTEVTDNREAERYEVHNDGQLAGFAEYRRGEDSIDFLHTEIFDEFSGQGLASTLISGALDDARDQNVDVRPFCSFVNSFIAKHPDYQDLVPKEERERFGLG